MDAIKHIRSKLGIQPSMDKAAARLKPTILHWAITYDPLIDLVPTPHMRDHMIIFRNQMDYDTCFKMILDGARYHSADPTLNDHWKLPSEFFNEFWYLAIGCDIRKTNKWRRKQQQQVVATNKPSSWLALLVIAFLS